MNRSLLHSALLVAALSVQVACGQPGTESEPPDQTAAEQAPAAEPASEPASQPAKPLDLTVTVTPGDGQAVDADYEKPKSLPGMFTATEKDRKTSLSVELIRDENNPDYVDSIQGGKVSLDVKVPQSKKKSAAPKPQDVPE